MIAKVGGDAREEQEPQDGHCGENGNPKAAIGDESNSSELMIEWWQKQTEKARSLSTAICLEVCL